jgi:hypothetical protein
MVSHPGATKPLPTHGDHTIARYWSNDDGPAPVHITGDALRTIYSGRKSGLLFLRAEGWTDCDVHFRDGKVVGCAGPADEWRLGRLLIATGTLTPEVLEGLIANLHTTWLADALVDESLLTQAALDDLVSELVKDNFLFACGAPWRSIWFDEHEIAFPLDLQRGFDTSQLFVEAKRWNAWVRRILPMLTQGQDPVLEAASVGELPGGDEQTVLRCVWEPIPYSMLLAHAPLVPSRTAAALVKLVATGTVHVLPG